MLTSHPQPININPTLWLAALTALLFLLLGPPKGCASCASMTLPALNLSIITDTTDRLCADCRTLPVTAARPCSMCSTLPAITSGPCATCGSPMAMQASAAVPCNICAPALSVFGPGHCSVCMVLPEAALNGPGTCSTCMTRSEQQDPCNWCMVPPAVPSTLVSSGGPKPCASC